MSEAPLTAERTRDGYAGLRMTADEYFCIPDDGYRYELIDGVVVVSPSPTPQHQRVVMEIALQLGTYLRDHPVGAVLAETDAHLGAGRRGDLVYRPEIVFIRAERLPEIKHRITGAPDLVVEVVSPDSRRYDTETKRTDYERFGVGEYWIVDPERQTMTFFRMIDGQFVAVEPSGDSFASRVVPGFVLDLPRVRKSFQSW
ncbi:MAG: Uma2 family endonuclease [Phycisphaerales bacterium]|nr:Uma2 family endonuclease [Phycisphaerales bacterium]